jgi:hypothetical protein
MGVYTPCIALGLTIAVALTCPASVQAFKCEPSDTVPSIPDSVTLEPSRTISSTVQAADSFSRSPSKAGTIAGPRPASANSPRVYIPPRRNAEGAAQVRTASAPFSLNQLTLSIMNGNRGKPRTGKSSVVPPPDCVPMVPPQIHFDDHEAPGSVPPLGK